MDPITELAQVHHLTDRRQSTDGHLDPPMVTSIGTCTPPT
jgi:hypothetical protein